MRFKHYRGNEIASIIEALAELRIAVFREYPYLYEGSLEYERDYLTRYAESRRAMVYTIIDENAQLVGATTCLPLSDEMSSLQKPFLEHGLNPEHFFYFGESIILPDYRGRGYGHRFFDEREREAAKWPEIRHCCFCAVDRPENHPLKPRNYRTLDAFWQKRGYKKREDLKSQLYWPDLGESKQSAKSLTFWLKNLK